MFLTIILVIGKILLLIFLVFLLALYLYFRKQYSYWEKRNVPHTKPVFPVGNLTGAGRKSVNTIFKELYNESKHQRYRGIYMVYTPVLIVNDPDLIQQITITDFAKFHSNGSYFDKENEPFSETLFTLEGKKWKTLRSKLSPIFTSGKLKAIFPQILKTSKNLQDALNEQVCVNQIIDVKDFALRFITDIIFSAVFGMEINFVKNPNSDLGVAANKAVEPTWTRAFKFFTAVFIPDVARVLKFAMLSKETGKIFSDLFLDIVEYRQKNNVRRNDVMQLLIELLEKGFIHDVNNVEEKDDAKYEFTLKDLSSQALTFLLGGFETSSNALSFALYELAKNPEIQKKLKKEIKEVLARHNQEITYEGIQEMKYLGRIFDETLRKYSVVPIVPRKCAVEFKDPISGHVIEKGTHVIIPVAGIHWDERYYPEPEKFDPDRFTKENKASRPSCTYLPSGVGPRFCIGQRLGLLQIKVGLVSILSKFDVNMSKEFTPDPLEFDVKALITAPNGKLMLELSVSNL